MILYFNTDILAILNMVFIKLSLRDSPKPPNLAMTKLELLLIDAAI